MPNCNKQDYHNLERLFLFNILVNERRRRRKLSSKISILQHKTEKEAKQN